MPRELIEEVGEFDGRMNDEVWESDRRMYELAQNLVENGVTDGWSVYVVTRPVEYSLDSVPYVEVVRDIDDKIERTEWIKTVSAFSIKYKSNYYTHIVHNDEVVDDNKYIASCPVAEPIASNNVERLAEHINSQSERITDAVRFNYEIERLSCYYRQVDCEGEIGKFMEQESPARFVQGIGCSQIRKLAQKFGTYYNLSQARVFEIPRFTNWHHPDRGEIQDSVLTTVDAYLEQVESGWDRVSVSPEKWTKYPVETVGEPHIRSFTYDELELYEDIFWNCRRVNRRPVARLIDQGFNSKEVINNSSIDELTIVDGIEEKDAENLKEYASNGQNTIIY